MGIGTAANSLTTLYPISKIAKTKERRQGVEGLAKAKECEIQKQQKPYVEYRFHYIYKRSRMRSDPVGVIAKNDF